MPRQLLKPSQLTGYVRKARHGWYQTHLDCKTLFCLVYDPDGHIINPRGLEIDLSRDRHGLPVRVRIRPRF